MAYFFFKAGIFYHPDKSLKEVCFSSAKRLLVPFAIFTAIGYVWFGAQQMGFSPLEWKYWWWPIRQIFAIGRVEGNGPMWFLLSLFFVRVFFQMTHNNRLAQIVLIVCCVVVSFLGNYFSIRPRTISNVAMGIVFYGLGALLRDAQYIKRVGISSVCVWILSYILMGFFGWQLIDFSFNTTVLGYQPIWLFNCVIACISVNYIFRFIPMKGFLSWLGVNSMPFLCIHSLVCEGLYTYWFSQTSLSPYTRLAIYWGMILIICGTMTFVFKSSYLCWVIGEREKKREAIADNDAEC